MSLRAVLYVLLTGSLFGSNLVVSRFGLSQLDATVYSGLRVSVAGAAFLGVYLVGHRHHPWPTDPRLWGHAAVLGVVGTAIPLVAIINSLNYQSSGITALLVTVSPALTVLLAHFLLVDEKLTWRRGAGVILALGGALLLAIRGESGLPDVSQASPIGYGLAFVGVVMISVVTIYMRKFMRNLDAFDVTSAQTFIATLVLLPLAWLWIGIDLRNVNWQGYLAVSYAGLIGTFASFLLYFYCVKQFGASRASMAEYVGAVVATFGGILFLDEQITVGILIGICLIAWGILLINTRPKMAGLDQER